MSDHLAYDLPGGRVLFTTRHGGVSTGPFASLNLGRLTDDEPANVDENRRRLGEVIGLPWERVCYGKQVHGARVRRATEPPMARDEIQLGMRDEIQLGMRDEIQLGMRDEVQLGMRDEIRLGEEDGQATALIAAAAVVFVADCLPVMLVADGAVAALHGGWRGLAGGIVAEGVRALREVGGAGEIRAVLGPSARGCCYEVGEEVHAVFDGDDARRGARNIDLAAVARRRLQTAGVSEIIDAEACTMCDERFFSHRRDGGVTGRQAGVVWRT